MIYAKDCLIPKNTPASDPYKHILKVTKGLIYKIEFQFPRGCAGLTHIVIFDGGHQAWPYDPGVDFYGDNWVISFDETYLIDAEPFEFDIFGYNLDDTYNHTVQVRLGIVSKEVYMARFMPTLAYKYFLEIIEKLERERAGRAEWGEERPFAWVVRPPEEEEEAQEGEEEESAKGST
ncbi:MAG: hypothetical protein HWN68_11115 [Desulfobacterales bacterium]|nr:hypothetical protein [Desulfobacterales bacterium]